MIKKFLISIVASLLLLCGSTVAYAGNVTHETTSSRLVQTQKRGQQFRVDYKLYNRGNSTITRINYLDVYVEGMRRGQRSSFTKRVQLNYNYILRPGQVGSLWCTFWENWGGFSSAKVQVRSVNFSSR